jgi:hypothetical protein
LLGCAVETTDAPHEDLVGHVQVALTEVPGNVGCLRLIAQQVPLTFQRDFSVVANQSTVLDFVGLPTGSVALSGAAFAPACSSVSSKTPATWVADPQTVTIASGSVTNIKLPMREAGEGSISVDFLHPLNGCEPYDDRTAAGASRVIDVQNGSPTPRCIRVKVGESVHLIAPAGWPLKAGRAPAYASGEDSTVPTPIPASFTGPIDVAFSAPGHYGFYGVFPLGITGAGAIEVVP